MRLPSSFLFISLIGTATIAFGIPENQEGAEITGVSSFTLGESSQTALAKCVPNGPLEYAKKQDKFFARCRAGATISGLSFKVFLWFSRSDHLQAIDLDVIGLEPNDADSARRLYENLKELLDEKYSRCPGAHGVDVSILGDRNWRSVGFCDSTLRNIDVSFSAGSISVRYVVSQKQTKAWDMEPEKISGGGPALKQGADPNGF